MKNIMCALVLALFAAAGTLCAQPLIGGKGDFHTAFDFARYYGDENRLFVELYYGIHENALTYREEGGQWAGSATMKYVVRNDSAVVSTKEWRVPHTLSDSSQLEKARILTGLESVALAPGEYAVTLFTSDANNAARTDSFSTSFTVSLFPKDRESFSDVELCTSIQASSDQQSLFYKNTLEVVPNAGRLYGTGLPMLYYYLEVYNLASGEAPLTLHTAIVDATGKELLSHDKQKPRLHEASVEIGTMNLSALNSGTYLFRASLMDSSNVPTISAAKKFFVYKLGSLPESLATDNAGYTASEYAFMSQEQIDKEFAYARYISTDHERTQYEMLTDLKAKQQFMYDFWARRNPHPEEAGENSFKKEYFRRVETANRNYSVGVKEGWRTDRGRIYIMYGPYDDIERNANTAESNPYETWHYNNIEGGIIFVFVDKNAMNDYLLVHSTQRNELHDDTWYQDYALKAR